MLVKSITGHLQAYRNEGVLDLVKVAKSKTIAEQSNKLELLLEKSNLYNA